jgi:preprotein translocase subunit SecD
MSDIRQLLKNWRILLLLAALLFATLSLFFNGLSYGIDFKGGTSFQIKLLKPASDAQQLETIRSIIEQRLDWTGLKDTRVNKIDNDLLVADVAETNSESIARMESLLQKQGKFEATLDGNLLFTGDDIVTISKDPAKGYGATKQSDGSFRWILPFMLSNSAAKRFTEMTFHKCTITGVDEKGVKTYSCDKTYFFIDRPTDAVLVFTANSFSKDKELLNVGNHIENIPAETKIEELLKNSMAQYIIADTNLSADQKEKLTELKKQEITTALLPEDSSDSLVKELSSLGFKTKKVVPATGIPFVWLAVGAKQVIFLSEDVTNMEPYISEVKDAKTYSELLIRGFGTDAKDAQKRLQDLTILLESGSLPIGVESISRETIPPVLGKEFLYQSALMCLISLLIVTGIIFFRYREIKLTIPIMMTAIFEVYLVLGFAALIHWNLDLASIAGIVAAVGTGVNDQIVITDEMLKGARETTTGSLSNRVKRAFFIILAAASTAIATMLPIFLFGSGLGKLVGFAITTISGVIAGITFTRPAYGEVAKFLLQKETK